MREASPLHELDSAGAPLLLFQGANDPRVRTLLYAANARHSFNGEITALAGERLLEPGPAPSRL